MTRKPREMRGFLVSGHLTSILSCMEGEAFTLTSVLSPQGRGISRLQWLNTCIISPKAIERLRPYTD
jgi:hypothetical protein